MKKKRILWAGLLVAVLVCWISWACWKGVIPGFADTTDISYGRLCGIEPSAGHVWFYEIGWGDGITYYRLQLTPEAFARIYGSSVQRRTLVRSPSDPWWWAPPVSYEMYVVSGGGLGPGDVRVDVYDPQRGLLYVRSEW